MHIPTSTVTESNLKRITAVIGTLTRSEVPSGIFLHPLAHGLEHPKYIGRSDEPLSVLEFYQSLGELAFSSIERDVVPDTGALRTAVRAAHREGIIPIGIACFDYQALTPRAVKRFLVQMKDGNDLSLEGLAVPTLLQNRQAKFARPLVGWAADAQAVTFSFEERWVVANTSERPTRIDFDAGDGRGIRHMAIGSRLKVSYPTPGEKTLRITCHDPAGSATSVSQIHVLAQSLPAPNETISIRATRAYKDVWAGGVMKIYYAPGRSNVEKPLFMWTGFNTGTAAIALSVPTPFDAWDATAELMWAISPSDLLEQARQHGYDIVMIEFDDSRTYIQANAALIEEAFVLINQRPSKKAPGILVTGSMGGLVARYTLLEMEARSLAHGIAKVIMLDTPCLGAVVPMCAQCGLDFLSDKVNEVKVLRDTILDSYAARQMLVQKYRPLWSGQDNPQPDELFDELQRDFVSLGNWPKQPELYAIANGNNQGKGQLTDAGGVLNPASQLASFERVDDKKNWKANGAFWTMPNSPETAEPGTKIVEMSCIGKLNWQAIVKKSLPWDTCPGGMASFIRLFATNGWTSHTLIAGNTCFVPTHSALAYKGQSDLYARVPDAGSTPFKSFYAPTENQSHAELNDGNVAWLRTILGIPAQRQSVKK